MDSDQNPGTGLGPGVRFSLDDGEQRHTAAPGSFAIPPAPDRAHLRVGDLVKLVFRITHDGSVDVERMWVRVDEVLPPGGGQATRHYLGSLDNQPLCTDGLAPGTVVAFQPRHVIDIWTEADR